MAKSLIWDAAAREHEMRESDHSQTPKERTILVLGNKNSGKSTILARFMDRTEERRPTTGLEYVYTRRATQNLGRDVAHLWELGGGSSLADLIDIPVKTSNIATFSVVIVLDLSRPEEMVVIFDELMTKVRSTVKAVRNQLKQQQAREVLNELHKTAWGKFGGDHPDKDLLAPLEVPLVILGSKYDLFRKLDLEKQKVICSTLRFLAHTNGASLQFMSAMSEGLVLRGKTILNHLAFGLPQSRQVLNDVDKPLIIPAGADSLGAIGPPPTLGADAHIQGKKPIDLWKNIFSAFFPQVTTKADTTEAPAADPQYAEAVVDEMRKQKDQELLRYKQATEKAAKEKERQQAAQGGSSSSKTPSKAADSGAARTPHGASAAKGKSKHAGTARQASNRPRQPS